jgi:hypothetical protein
VPLVTVVIDASLSSNARHERRPHSRSREKAGGANELFDAPAGLVLDPVADS